MTRDSVGELQKAPNFVSVVSSRTSHKAATMTGCAGRRRTTFLFLFLFALTVFSLIGNSLIELKTFYRENGDEFSHLPPSTKASGPRTQVNDTGPFFSACLLTMDDNHFLIEWLAYHYHTLLLRHLIVAVDPKSRTSPKRIFDRWRNQGMMIEEWGDSDFMPPQLSPEENATEIKLHHTRQRIFYAKCMKELKAANRTWTLFLDSDEYLVINKRRKSHVSAPSMKGPGSVLWLIQQELSKNETELPKESPCIMVPRLRYGSVESENIADAPSGLNASAFQTLRFRKHATFENFTMNKIAKAIFDVSRVREEDILVNDPHRLVWAHCPESQLYTKIDDNLFLVHHYLGTWEQYSFRDDVRKVIREGNRSRKSFDRYKDVDAGDDDSIRPWLDGFVEDKGMDVASKVLKGVGDVLQSESGSF